MTKKIASDLNYKKARLGKSLKPLKEFIDKLIRGTSPEELYQKDVLSALNKAKKQDDVPKAVIDATNIDPKKYELDHLSDKLLDEIKAAALMHFIILAIDTAVAKTIAQTLIDTIRQKFNKK